MRLFDSTEQRSLVRTGTEYLVRRLLAVLLLATAVWASGTAVAAVAPDPPTASDRVEVVVELAPPPAARAGWQASRDAAGARVAIQRIERAQHAAERRILASVPAASIGWRYRIVLDGLAVSLPRSELGRLACVPGIVQVYPTRSYHALADDGPAQIGAPTVWGPTLAVAGAGIRIGIIDQGIDPGHPYFRDDGLSMPAGFPKGNAAYTSAKVIVARAFPPPGERWRYAGLPYDPVYSYHGDHVAGIAAGAAGTIVPATDERPQLTLSGVAPLAYLGNYKALTVPTPGGGGLNGNSPELVAAIEAAVADGMDVINLSLGEPEIEPSRDVVARALDNAARAGVIPVVAAGNDFDELGRGTIGSPGTSQLAITVGAVTAARYFGSSAHVLGPAPVPASLATFGGVSSPPGITGELDRELVLRDAASSGDPRLCSPRPEGSLAAAVVLARAGGCAVFLKAEHALAAGAVAVVLAISEPGDPGFVPPARLPVLAVARDIGSELGAFVAASGGSATLRFDAGPSVVASEEAGRVASFSSSGPTPLGLLLKPDVSAPGVDILSAQPRAQFDLLSGTSMAAPHVAGAAALLRELHPDWTVAEVKSALVVTADRVWADAARKREVPATREGGGLIDVPAAAQPLLSASPATLSFGLLDVSHGAASATADVTLADAGGGAGQWSVSVQQLEPGPGASVEVASGGEVAVPGVLTVRALAGAPAAEGERTGFVVLSGNGVERRIPYWFRVTRPRLPTDPARRLPGPGTYDGDTSRGVARVDRYRYPASPALVLRVLRGPEQVFRIVLGRPAANLGVAVVSEGSGVRVEPRIVAGADENRLLGPLALPFVANPYLESLYERRAVVGVLDAAPGTYSIVFDTSSVRWAGRFRFRVWVGDTTRPTVRLLSRAAAGGFLRVRAFDAGSGVDPDGVEYSIDGVGPRHGELTPSGLVLLDVLGVRPGLHRLTLRVSDRQEAKNDENVAGVLPNTRTLVTTFRVPAPRP